jgi:glutamyl-tRNA synthetase
MGGSFILRVDDTDKARSTSESLENILVGLRWLGIDWDEGPDKGGDFGPYFQSERMSRYQERVDRLLDEKKAYRCFCSPERIQEGRERMQKSCGLAMYDRSCRGLSEGEVQEKISQGIPFTVRFAIQGEGKVQLQDKIKGLVEVDLRQMDDWVMLRADGSPLYNLCSALDDADMKITHIIRGEEHFMNGVKQMLLLQALGEAVPEFAHLPLILGKNGKKLSKRMAQTNLLDYKDQGYPADALVNFFTLLGWGFDAEREIFSVKEAIERFRLEDVGKSGSILDEDKLAWMCGMYIRKQYREEFLQNVIPWIVKEGLASEKEISQSQEWFANLLACDQERVRKYEEIPSKIAHYFEDNLEYDKKAWKNLKKSEEIPELLKAWKESLETVRLPGSWPQRSREADTQVLLPTNKENPSPPGGTFSTPKELEDAARAVAEVQGVGFGKMVHPIRAALTGTTMGPSLFDIVYLLGRDRVQKRVEAALKALANKAS